MITKLAVKVMENERKRDTRGRQTIAERMTRYKAQTGLLNEQIAEKFGVGPVVVSHWINGRAGMNRFNMQTLERFERELGFRETSTISRARTTRVALVAGQGHSGHGRGSL